MAVSSYWKTQATGLQELQKEIADAVKAAESEIKAITRAIEIHSSDSSYIKLQDMGFTIEESLPNLQDISDVMKDIGWRLEAKDRIDG